MLHVGTLVALLVYFWADWVRLVPAGFAAIRDRSFEGDLDRRLAWLLVVATIPAAIAGYLLSDTIETAVREVQWVVVTMVIGAVILWLADRWGGRTKGVEDVTFPIAGGIGVAQALALVPGFQSLRDQHLRRPVRRARPRGRRPVLVPDGDAGHGRGGRLRGPQAAHR